MSELNCSGIAAAEWPPLSPPLKSLEEGLGEPGGGGGGGGDCGDAGCRTPASSLLLLAAVPARCPTAASDVSGGTKTAPAEAPNNRCHPAASTDWYTESVAANVLPLLRPAAAHLPLPTPPPRGNDRLRRAEVVPRRGSGAASAGPAAPSTYASAASSRSAQGGGGGGLSAGDGQ